MIAAVVLYINYCYRDISLILQLIGSEGTYGPHSRNLDPREATVWMAVEHANKDALNIFAREMAPAGTGMGR